MLRAAMHERHGEQGLRERFRAFDTICSATQDRQDAVIQMLAEVPLDVMIVVGGFNSSNTQALARICVERLPTYHIDSGGRIADDVIQHRPVGPEMREESAVGWLPPGPVRIGLTAGASTPNSVVAEVVERILAARGVASGALGLADPVVPTGR
jgi:4-hydroxy-3-methylbut-2-enyl diphosphate reductase